MPPPQYVSPFPPLVLSSDEREMLTRTANDLVDQAQKKYEWFLWQERERLDSERWQFVRTRDDMTVYVDRLLADETGNRNMQLLLMTGSIQGTLHDAMYGVLSNTTSGMQLRTAYVQDTLLDGAVLETILKPTPEDPFQSLTLWWFVKGVPLHVRAVTKKHGDNVSIEASGMRQLYGGEQIGFQLIHSVMLAETPPLPQYDRYNLSTCTFWRQVTPQRVQAYTTCFIEIAESFMIPFQVKSIADAFVSESRTAHCAKMKKLAWLIKHKDTMKGGDSDASNSTLKNGAKGGCSVCGSQNPSALPCAVCSKPTCITCRVKNELFAIGADRQLIKTKARVCHPCMKTVDQLDAVVVAQREAMKREQQDERLTMIVDNEMRASTASSASSSVSSESIFS